jgi:hypothetical protein
MLWIIPFDLIEGASRQELSNGISQFGYTIWEFECGSIAFSSPEVLVRRGSAVDHQHFLTWTRPVFRFLRSVIGAERDALDLEIPDTKFWSRVSLKPEETNTRSCRYFKSKLTAWSPFGFKVYSSYEIDARTLDKIKLYLTMWMSTCSKQLIHGESLVLGDVDIKEYSSPRTEKNYPERGFEVNCSEYTPCTWPWIDLYLRMRRELPVRERLSIEFFNP